MAASESPIPKVTAENRYTGDPSLQALLARHVSAEARRVAEEWLYKMGRFSVSIVDRFSVDADAHPPKLEQYDARGERVDCIVYHTAHLALEHYSFGFGIVGHYYDPELRTQLGGHLWQLKIAHFYLFAP